MLISKILVTVFVVLALAYIAENVSAKVAGVLAGYPLGIAIVLVFLGLEQGVGFAAQAAAFAVLGLLANLALAIAYWWLAKHAGDFFNVCFAGLAGVASFLLIAYLVKWLPASLWIAVPVTLMGLLLGARLMLQVPAVPQQVTAVMTKRDTLFRAATAALTVVLITGIAKLVGAVWAGLLAGFPVVAFPLFLILHYHHGKPVLSNSIRVYPLGLVSLLVYTTAVAITYPVLGLLWGTLVGFVLATVYVLMLPVMQKFLLASASAESDTRG